MSVTSPTLSVAGGASTSSGAAASSRRSRRPRAGGEQCRLDAHAAPLLLPRHTLPVGFSTLRRKPRWPRPTTPPLQSVLSVVLQVREGKIAGAALAAGARPRSPARGRSPADGSKPTRRSRGRSGGTSRRKSTCASSRTSSSSGHAATRAETRRGGSSRPLSSASCPPASTRSTRRHGVAPAEERPHSAFDHGEIALAARERLRAKLSYSNVAFALAPRDVHALGVRGIYGAALGHDVSATNLQAGAPRRSVLESTDGGLSPGRRADDPPTSTASARAGSRSPTFAALRPPPASNQTGLNS